MIVLWLALWCWSSLLSPSRKNGDGCGCLIPTALYLLWVLFVSLFRSF
jgi:hypothetical protein